MTGWQPIETAPRDGAKVLLWTDTRLCKNADTFALWGCEHFQCVQIGYWEDDVDAPMRKEMAGWRTEFVGEASHWMPLPPPPGSDEELVTA
jgi:hypothetical protein